MFKSLLVANRGEIACRIIRTARQMGIKTITVFAPGEEGAMHSRLADESLPLPSGKTAPYLNIAAIIARAKKRGAEAAHPGCGFLAENPDFARACAKAGLVFVGPSPKTMTVAGSKIAARKLTQKAGARVLPGADLRGEKGAVAAAKKTGFPLMLKAAAGGGGRGMRIAYSADELPAMLRQAAREAKHAFGDGALMMEKYLPRARHLEAQFLADKSGAVLVLGERDCSMQRRHQKMLEESPAPSLGEKTRRELHSLAKKIATAANYENAGTAEFLLAEGRLWFLEINARLQVEHTVTEELLQTDLVEWQLRIAAGELLPKKITAPAGAPQWAMEARVCCENPMREMLPAAGTVAKCRFPEMPGVRVDAGIAAGDCVSGEYDSLLAKIIAAGESREHSRELLLRALAATKIEGVVTNIPLLSEFAGGGAFAKGEALTVTVEKEFSAALSGVRAQRRTAVMLAAAWRVLSAPLPLPCFRLNGARRGFVVLHDDDECRRCAAEVRGEDCSINDGEGEIIARRFSVSAEGISADIDGVRVFAECAREKGGSVTVFLRGLSLVLCVGEPPSLFVSDGGGGGDIAVAPMPGVVREINSRVGAAVKKGEALMTLEAMKMEVTVAAPRGGRVLEISRAAGDVVAAGDLLARIGGDGDDGGG